jgi:hypothetical protein
LYAIFLPFSAALFCFIVLSAFNFKRFSSISASVVANFYNRSVFFLNGDWFMQRGQTPMFASEIIYTPYFYLQKRTHVGSINEFSSKTRLSLIDRMTINICTLYGIITLYYYGFFILF